MIDHGERLEKFITLLGRAYLTMLNSLDRAKKLGPDSEFRDIGLVSGLYMAVSEIFGDSYDSDTLDWKLYIQDYMEANKIDSTIVFGSPEINLDDGTDAMDERDGIPKPGPDRWKFKAAVSLLPSLIPWSNKYTCM